MPNQAKADKNKHVNNKSKQVEKEMKTKIGRKRPYLEQGNQILQPNVANTT